MRERGDVDLNHVQLAVQVCIGELATEPEARVVHQHLDRNVLVLLKVEDLLRCVEKAEVGGEDLNPPAEFSLDLTGGTLERIALAGHEDDIEPVAGENLRKLETDSTGASRDQRGRTLGAVSFLTHRLKLAIPDCRRITERIAMSMSVD